ncbi:hypothetical protein, partial [Cupriavidus pinatubonensis]|uniref:hypothetical protein n=1 Tax=Cupriavidus pinatubonensis TaxID=248026 RepID=UPI001CC482D2
MIGGATTLKDQRKIRLVEGVTTDQFVLAVGESEQALPLDGGKYGTAWHANAFDPPESALLVGAAPTSGGRFLGKIRSLKRFIQIMGIIALCVFCNV